MRFLAPAEGFAVRSIVLGIGVAAMIATSAAAQNAASANLALHDALGLSAAQESAWQDYTGALAPSPEAPARHRATDLLLPQLTTPRRIALIEATMAADAADWRRQGEAVKAFYASLSPDQQRTFDRETAAPAQGASSPRGEQRAAPQQP
jgi:hypothetical protein